MTILRTRDLTKSYRIPTGLFGHTDRYALRGVDLSVQRREAVGIVGESGCGKSTLAKLLVGLVPPSSGQILLDGQVLPPARPPQLLRRVQMVFQDPSASLNPRLTVRQTLTELLAVHRLVPPRRWEDRVRELLDAVGLPHALADQTPRRLSGGQKQRVGIARALALEPEILIADESVAALDVSVQASILALLRRLQRELDLTLLFITHDLAVVRQVSDRLYVMSAGEVVEECATEAFFAGPAHEYSRRLLASAPRMRFEAHTPGLIP